MTDHGFTTTFTVDRTPAEAYVDGSLRSLITTGEGQPNGSGRPRLPAEEAAAGQRR